MDAVSPLEMGASRDAKIGSASTTSNEGSAQPIVDVRAHEFVVGQLRIERAHAVDLLGLAGRKLLLRIEAPAAGQQTLAAQNLVDAGNASAELVRGVEQRGVGIGQPGGQREQLGWE